MSDDNTLSMLGYNTPAQNLAGDIYWQVWFPGDIEEGGINSLAVATHAKISIPVNNASYLDFDDTMTEYIENPHYVRH